MSYIRKNPGVFDNNAFVSYMFNTSSFTNLCFFWQQQSGVMDTTLCLSDVNKLQIARQIACGMVSVWTL